MLTEPFAIGQALYDAGRMDVGMSSLLRLMGIGIYDRDGTPVRRGHERVAGAPWLTVDEFWGLTDMGIRDLLEAGDGDLRYRLADLHKAIAPLLPGTTLAQFTAAYTEAYAAHPDDLVPQLLLGQPIDASTPLTRVQLWLLYIDGFVELAEPVVARHGAGTLVAQAGPPSGTANANLPALVPPAGLSGAQWTEIEFRALVLALNVSFSVSVVTAHEGHGGQGDPVEVIAVVGVGQFFVSPMTGQTLLAGRSSSSTQAPLTWSTRSQQVLDAHGSTNISLPATAIASGGVARLVYTPKREAADGQGFEASEWATVEATIAGDALLGLAYDLDPALAEDLAGLVGERDASGGIDIRWHDVGLEIEIINTYDVTLQLAPAGLEARAHRSGTDTFKGVLTPRLDGLYYAGTIEATSRSDSQMDFAVPLAGDRCEDSTDSFQRLDVVGIPITTHDLDPTVDILNFGTFGTTDLVLRFYPATPPGGTLGRCQGTTDYFGPGPMCFENDLQLQPTPDPVTGIEPEQCPGQWIYGTYLAFSDARITTPSNGYLIHLPPTDETLRYQDWRQVVPELNVDSVFDITVRAAGAP